MKSEEENYFFVFQEKKGRILTKFDGNSVVGPKTESTHKMCCTICDTVHHFNVHSLSSIKYFISLSKHFPKNIPL